MCYCCRFLVNTENHGDSCQTTGERALTGEQVPLPELPTGDHENQEPDSTAATAAEAATTATTTAAADEAREALDIICAGFLVLHEDVNCTTALTQGLRATQRGEAQARQVRNQVTQQQLQQVMQVLEGVLRNERFLVDHAGYQL
jgi:hypothetical protein